jgi:hypothetical protein
MIKYLLIINVVNEMTEYVSGMTVPRFGDES